MQLNTILFAKTLVRKDVASAAGSSGTTSENPESCPASGEDEEQKKKDSEDDFSSKAQIMTLMTTDVDRVSDFAWHIFTLVGESYLCGFAHDTISHFQNKIRQLKSLSAHCSYITSSASPASLALR